MKVHGKYFYGNEISEYGQKNGYVDYRTLARAFDAVLNNDIISKTSDIGYWEPWSGSEEYYEDEDGNTYDYSAAQEKIAEIEDAMSEIEDEGSEEYRKLEEEKEMLGDAYYHDIFQWFIVSDNGAEILKEAGEIVYYNEYLDMYVWGVTHYGTSWDCVLTNIRCNAPDDEEG